MKKIYFITFETLLNYKGYFTHYGDYADSLCDSAEWEVLDIEIIVKESLKEENEDTAYEVVCWTEGDDENELLYTVKNGKVRKYTTKK